jgi:hypothetical protein
MNGVSTLQETCTVDVIWTRGSDLYHTLITYQIEESEMVLKIMYTNHM